MNLFICLWCPQSTMDAVWPPFLMACKRFVENTSSVVELN